MGELGRICHVVLKIPEILDQFEKIIQPPRLFTSRLLKVSDYWVHQTLNRFSTPNYTEKPLTPVPNSLEG